MVGFGKYFQEQWLEANPPSDWASFGRQENVPSGTQNLEAYHNRMDTTVWAQRYGCNLPVDSGAKKLHEEALYQEQLATNPVQIEERLTATNRSKQAARATLKATQPSPAASTPPISAPMPSSADSNADVPKPVTSQPAVDADTQPLAPSAPASGRKRILLPTLEGMLLWLPSCIE